MINQQSQPIFPEPTTVMSNGKSGEASQIVLQLKPSESDGLSLLRTETSELSSDPTEERVFTPPVPMWSADEFFADEDDGTEEAARSAQSKPGDMPISVSVIPTSPIKFRIPLDTEMQVTENNNNVASLEDGNDEETFIPDFQTVQYITSPTERASPQSAVEGTSQTASQVSSEVASSSDNLLSELDQGPTKVCRIKLNTSDPQIRTLLDQGAIIMTDPSGDGTALLVPPSSVSNPQLVVQESGAMVEVNSNT